MENINVLTVGIVYYECFMVRHDVAYYYHNLHTTISALESLVLQVCTTCAGAAAVLFPVFIF